MSQVNELLNTMAEEDIVTYTADPENEPHIVIDKDRFAKVPEELRRIAVEDDHNVETVTFDCPRYWDEHDLTKMVLYIRYACPDGKSGGYRAQNVRVDGAATDMIHFDWTISENVTGKAGTLAFMVVAKKSNEESGESLNRWHSEPNTEMYISKGIPGEDVDYTTGNPDLLTQVLLLAERCANAKPTKYEIAEILKSELPLIKTAEQPAFASTVEECTDPEKIYVLPDGYMYAHDVRYVKYYTNILPTLTDADGNIFNGCGYQDDLMLSYDGRTWADTNRWCTGFIPFTKADVLRMRNVVALGESFVPFYDSSKTRISSVDLRTTVGSENGQQLEENGDYTLTGSKIWIPQGIENVAYIRVGVKCGTETPDFDSMIFTLNEEIIEGEVDGFFSTGLVYQPMDCEERIIELEDDVGELKDDVTELKEMGGNVTFDYAAYGLPELALTGNVSSMTKDNAVTLDYVYGDRTGTCTVKWQGSSSLSYPKKNYTIKFDNAFEAVEGWGEQKKYCFKANYIDHSHARNVVSAKLWGTVVRSRNPENATLEALPNCGAIDGFPCVITINGEYMGLYTFNIPKDGWMFGMGNGTNEAILCAESANFKQEAVVGTNYDLEYVTDENDTEWVTTSINRLINACINSDGTDIDTTVAQYIDWESAIDYYIFLLLIDGIDMIIKNYLIATYDGVKWFFTPYDMDNVFGLHWNGKSFRRASSYGVNYYASMNRVFEMIKTYKKDALKARYTQLRSGVLSEAYVIEAFSNFVCKIPERIYLSDTEVWPLIPSSAASNLAQIVNWYQTRVKIIDAQIEAL